MSPIEDLLREAKERVKNPIIGAFGISFFLFNWKIFSHLFLGDSPVNARLQAIDQLEVLTWQPIATALAYVILMPWVSLVIEWVRQFGTDKLIQLKKSQDPRITRNEKLKADRITLRDAIQAIRPNGVDSLDGVISEMRNLVSHFCQNVSPSLSNEKQIELHDLAEKLNRNISKLLGTPFDPPEMKNDK